jgi:hypothetical protein
MRTSGSAARFNSRCERYPAANKEVHAMPTWLWVLIIVLVVLALFGGVGYRSW